MKEAIFELCIWVFISACWIKAVYYDIAHSNALWAVVDVLFAPLGILRGLFLFFGG